MKGNEIFYFVTWIYTEKKNRGKYCKFSNFKLETFLKEAIEENKNYAGH